jgi:hypothetical protein
MLALRRDCNDRSVKTRATPIELMSASTGCGHTSASGYVGNMHKD